MDPSIIKLKKHPAFVHTETIAHLCKPLRHLDITTFSHLRLIQGESIAAISTNPVFMENYVKRKYYNADVHASPKHCHLLNCLMWDNIDVKGETANMLQDAADFQFRHIFTVIKQYPPGLPRPFGPRNDVVDFYHFGTHLNLPAINQLYVNQQDLLEKFIRYFNASVSQSPELNAAYDIQFKINPATQAFDADIESLGEEQKSQFLSAIPTAVHLTAREHSLIPLLIQGFTNKEIGIALGISYRTIEDYVVSLKNKLQARNKAELIARLVGIIQSKKHDNIYDI